MTWKCPSCSESHGDDFDSCWKCGTSRSGQADVGFKHAKDVSPADGSLETQFKRRFRCVRCGSKDALVKRLATSGTGLTRLLNVQNNRFLSVSCQKCALVEMFDLDVLEGRDGLTTALDLLFGR